MNKELEKINEIIEYFKSQREILYQNFLKEDYHQKSMLSFSVSSVAVFVALLSPLMVYLFIKEVSGVLFFMVLILLLVFGYSIFHFVYFSYKTERKYFEKIIKLDGILEFLWHLKITENIQGINLLIKEFSKGLKDYRRIYAKDYENIKLDEFIDAMDRVNNKIKENKNG